MIEVLYEDRNIVACVKPVGIVSQNDSEKDMVKILGEQLGNQIFPVHRLDTTVGGTMIFAKNSHTAAKLSKQIQNGGFLKTYLAVIEGIPEKDEDTWIDLLFKDLHKNKSFVVKRERKGVKKASLSYKLLASSNDKALVKVRLHTGRTHQIRVQFSSRKMPLAGDGKYGSKDNGCSVALWSEKIQLTNEKTTEYVSLPNVEVYPWCLFSDVINNLKT